jgi:hypothetical protein
MNIPPCKKYADGKHQWHYENRKHKNKFRRFVRCACGQRAQESADGIKFTTARQFLNPKRIIGSYRIDEARKAEILSAGYKSINHYVNASVVIRLPYKS